MALLIEQHLSIWPSPIEAVWDTLSVLHNPSFPSQIALKGFVGEKKALCWPNLEAPYLRSL